MFGRHETLVLPPLIKFSRRPLRFDFGTTGTLILAGASLPESRPRNGDLPKSSFTRWQHRCHRLEQRLIEKKILACCGAISSRKLVMRASRGADLIFATHPAASFQWRMSNPKLHWN
jgi:hypothetical protein